MSEQTNLIVVKRCHKTLEVCGVRYEHPYPHIEKEVNSLARRDDKLNWYYVTSNACPGSNLDSPFSHYFFEAR